MPKIKSEVIIQQEGEGKGAGFWIIVKDQYSKDELAVTFEELEKIVLYGQVILNNHAQNK